MENIAIPTILKNFGCRILHTLESLSGVQPPMVTVLGYHAISYDGTTVDVTPENFDHQMKYLKERYAFITLDQVVDYIEGKRNVTRPSIALTFDDGYTDVHSRAMPLLKKYRIPATVFVLARPNHANREELANHKPLLTLGQIKQLQKQGWVIGCHSATHQNFESLSHDGYEEEIVESKKILEKKLHTKIRYISYPKGVFNGDVYTMCKQSGYRAGFTTDAQIVSRKTDIFQIPRVGVDGSITAEQFPALLTRSCVYYFSLKNRLGKLLRLVRRKGVESKNSFLRKDKFRKPTIIELAKAGLLSALESTREPRDIVTPYQIGPYRLISKVQKDNPYKHYGIGIYRGMSKKYFIKTWTGKWKEFRYYGLINEYVISNVLHQKLSLLNSGGALNITTPRALACYTGKDTLSIVFEFIDGKPLSSFPLVTQANVLSQVLNAFDTLSHLLTKKERSVFPTRGISFYLFALPYLTVLSLLTNTSSYKVILKGFIHSLVLLPTIPDSSLTLSHRDFNPDNVLVSKSGVYVLDCERIAFTIPGYDIAYLSLSHDLSELSAMLSPASKSVTNEFLRTYISIQLAKIYDPLSGENHYLSSLYQMYA